MTNWVDVQESWNEAELSDFWLSEMLRNRNGWGTNPRPQIGFRYRKEAKSSGPGRLDTELWHDRHVVGCIELKSPQTNFQNESNLKLWIKQASKYSVTRCNYHHGKIVSPIGILTNGHHAVIFNGSLPHDQVLNFHTVLDLSAKADREKFLWILDTRNWTNGVSDYPYSDLKFQESRKSKIVGGGDQLARDILKLFKKIRSQTKSDDAAFKATNTLFMLAVLRDCGLFPNDQIKRLASRPSKESWQQIVSGVEQILHSDLTVLKSTYCDGIWSIYEDTSWFSGNLATFQATGLGKAYENLLHFVSDNSTSYYTPSDLIEECLGQMNPTSQHKALDPTCGSGSFLASIVEHVAEFESLNTNDLRTYVEECIFGVDKDPFACEIAKCVIASVYANSIPYSQEGANRYKAPKINIINDNFFKWKTKERFDLVIGNPPWGNIEAEVVEPEITETLLSFKSYRERSDVCCFVVEKAINLLKPQGRFAFLCKHEILDGKAHADHRNEVWLNHGATVWDYGRHHWFSNAARTILVFGKHQEKISQWNHVAKHKTAKKKIEKYSGKRMDALFEIHEGHISGRDSLYRHLGENFPNDAHSREEIEDHCISPYIVATTHRTFFLPRSEKLSTDIREYAKSNELVIRYKKSKELGITEPTEIMDSIYKHIFRRSDCARQEKKKKYEGWSWVFPSADNFIVMPTYVRGDRVRAAYATDAMVPTSTTIFMFPKNRNLDTLFYTLAFLNSSFAFEVITNHPKLRQADAGKTAVKPDALGHVLVPDCENPSLRKKIIGISKLLSHWQVEIDSRVFKEATEFLDPLFLSLAYKNSDAIWKAVPKAQRLLEKIKTCVADKPPRVLKKIS